MLCMGGGSHSRVVCDAVHPKQHRRWERGRLGGWSGALSARAGSLAAVMGSSRCPNPGLFLPCFVHASQGKLLL